MRIESDSIGTIEVDDDRYWGSQTQRSLEHFDIGGLRFRFTRPVIRALGLVKRCACLVNCEMGLIRDDLVDAMVRACDEVIDGGLDPHFPLVVFQTGSGTQTNMNANEVIANRANELLGFARGSKHPVHPNDQVNRSQSSNDVFPTVMHVAISAEVTSELVPAVGELRSVLAASAERFAPIVKLGRTHLQDATPITLGQEFSDWVAQLDFALGEIDRALHLLDDLAIGATAVGTGMNSPAGFGDAVAAHLAAAESRPFRPAPNLFAAISSHQAVVVMSSSLRTLALALAKLANDVRWLASGPRGGIGELLLPENEPGSSIMPGKVNPTQSEAMLMVVAQVIGNDASVAYAGSQGNFQLNVAKPVILHNVLESVALLSDTCRSFSRHCALGIEPNTPVIEEHLRRSLMTATALAPHVGYEAAAAVAKHAQQHDLDLRTAAIELGIVAERFDEWVVPKDMTRPN